MAQLNGITPRCAYAEPVGVEPQQSKINKFSAGCPRSAERELGCHAEAIAWMG
jgi:hypothetical protein